MTEQQDFILSFTDEEGNRCYILVWDPVKKVHRDLTKHEQELLESEVFYRWAMKIHAARIEP
jgi:hypothetical protein